MKRQIIIDGDIARIPLTRGYTAIIDVADVGLVEGYDWCALKSRHCRTTYARRVEYIDGKQVCILLHRVILGLSDTSVRGDHKDGDGLNNRRSNLRECNNVENMRNRGAQRNNKSGFKGVTFDPNNKKWRANISVAGLNKHIGYFPTAEEAYAGYCAAAHQFHGEFARVA